MCMLCLQNWCWRKNSQRKFSGAARCEILEKNLYIDPTKFIFAIIVNQNGMKMQAPTPPKFEISVKFSKMRFLKNYEVGTSKPEIGSGFSIFEIKIWFSKLENRFLQFLLNLISRPQNSNSPSSKNPKSTFFTPKFKFYFFSQNLDFVLGCLSCVACRTRREQIIMGGSSGWEKKIDLFSKFQNISNRHFKNI